MTVGELEDRYLEPFREQLRQFSKEALVLGFCSLAWIEATRYSPAERFEADLRAGLDKALGDLKKWRSTARIINRDLRFRSAMSRHKYGADCNECEWWRHRSAKKKGARIPGGTGKCTRPGGHCYPKTVRGKR